MEVRILDIKEQQTIYGDAYKLLVAADNEFIPPLSSRSSSTQQTLSNHTKRADGINQYFEQLKEQRFVVAFENEKLIAFVSYKENYNCAEIPNSELPNIYITTLIVSHTERGKGVTKSLYNKLFGEYKNVNIFTRTWSTNIAHTKILENYGFEILKIIENDRGNGIDTVYYKKAPKC